MKEGVSVNEDLPVSDAARRIKIVTLDSATNAVGSVTIPVNTTRSASGH